MERLCHETVLKCGDIVKHPDPYDGAAHLVTSGQGLIFTAYDYEKQKLVVIKKTKYNLCNIRQIQNQEQIDRYERAKNVYREFELGILVNHKNIMNILDAYTPDQTFQSFQDIYLVFELMDQRDLRHFHFHNWNEICHHQNGAPLFADIMLQLFSAIAYLHQDKLRLIHRDIKPDNIFIKQQQQSGEDNYIVKLGDLGHARQIPPKEGQPMTMNITTTQYRAPEVIKK
jgi:serine/threonine protein kinase